MLGRYGAEGAVSINIEDGFAASGQAGLGPSIEVKVFSGTKAPPGGLESNLPAAPFEHWSQPFADEMWGRSINDPFGPEAQYINAAGGGMAQEIARAAMNLPGHYDEAILRAAAGYGQDNGGGGNDHDPGENGGGWGGGSKPHGRSGINTGGINTGGGNEPGSTGGTGAGLRAVANTAITRAPTRRKTRSTMVIRKDLTMVKAAPPFPSSSILTATA